MTIKGTNTRQTSTIIKNCERCSKPFEVGGVRKKNRFCSYSCANVRLRSEDSNLLTSISVKKYFSTSLSEAHRAKKSLQTRLYNENGLMGTNKGKERALFLDPDFYDNNLTNPDEYFLVPLTEEDLKVESGDIWEEMNIHLENVALQE